MRELSASVGVWPQSRFMAVHVLMILVLNYVLIYYGLDKLLFEINGFKNTDY